MDKFKPTRKVAPDGGYGWVATFGVSLVNVSYNSISSLTQTFQNSKLTRELYIFFISTVRHAKHWTLVRSSIRWHAERSRCGYYRCSINNQHIGYHDESLRTVGWSFAKGILVSKSRNLWFTFMRNWSSDDSVSWEYGSYSDDIFGYKW